MKLGRPVTEAEVVASLLRSELDSSRFGPQLAALLEADGMAASVVMQPDLEDAQANAYRLDLLDRHRGWSSRTEMFRGFPLGVDWFRARFTRNEVLGIRYMNWDWWLQISGGTRLATDAADRIRSGEEGEGRGKGYEPLAARLASGDPPPELIAVTPDHERFVLIEGHMRLTAYALFPAFMPTELDVLLGVSAQADRWWAF
jgi:hypothetical protein